jgi:hypothetical protein
MEKILKRLEARIFKFFMRLKYLGVQDKKTKALQKIFARETADMLTKCKKVFQAHSFCLFSPFKALCRSHRNRKSNELTLGNKKNKLFI